MKLVTATTTFLLNREGWVAGDSRQVTDTVAAELLHAGLVVATGELEEAPASEGSPSAMPPAPKPAKQAKKRVTT